eukprot:2757954-Prymnesium_polylepis.1
MPSVSHHKVRTLYQNVRSDVPRLESGAQASTERKANPPPPAELHGACSRVRAQRIRGPAA